MVRTRASVNVRVSGAKTSRKLVTSKESSTKDSSSSSRSNNKSRYSGGNTYFPRETPAWQKSVKHFFNASESDDSGSTSNDSGLEQNIILDESLEETVVSDKSSESKTESNDC